MDNIISDINGLMTEENLEDMKSIAEVFHESGYMDDTQKLMRIGYQVAQETKDLWKEIYRHWPSDGLRLQYTTQMASLATLPGVEIMYDAQTAELMKTSVLYQCELMKEVFVERGEEAPCVDLDAEPSEDPFNINSIIESFVEKFVDSLFDNTEDDVYDEIAAEISRISNEELSELIIAAETEADNEDLSDDDRIKWRKVLNIAEAELVERG